MSPLILPYYSNATACNVVLYCTVLYCVQAHSEQITAPINNKKGNKLASVNHSFSEPDLLRLFSKYRWLISDYLQ